MTLGYGAGNRREEWVDALPLPDGLEFESTVRESPAEVLLAIVSLGHPACEFCEAVRQELARRETDNGANTTVHRHEESGRAESSRSEPASG